MLAEDTDEGLHILILSYFNPLDPNNALSEFEITIKMDYTEIEPSLDFLNQPPILIDCPETVIYLPYEPFNIDLSAADPEGDEISV